MKELKTALNHREDMIKFYEKALKMSIKENGKLKERIDLLENKYFWLTNQNIFINKIHAYTVVIVMLIGFIIYALTYKIF